MASKLVGLLESYRGRDKVIRIACYSSMLAGGVIRNNDLAKRFSIFAGQMSDCRTMLRLFDDLSWCFYVAKNGLFGVKGDDLIVKITKFFTHLSIQVFYPLEHIAWAMDRKILDGKSGRLWVAGIVCWITCLISEVIQSLWLLITLEAKEASWRKQHKLDLETQTDDENERKGMGSTTDASTQQSIDRQLKQAQSKHARQQWLQAKRQDLLVSMIGSMADLGNAIHWSFPGFLWAGKLPQSLVGLLGTISSASLLYSHLYPVKPIQEVNKKEQ